jgi:hypothetical protein
MLRNASNWPIASSSLDAWRHGLPRSVAGVSAQVTLDAASQQSVLERLAIPRRLHQQRGTRCLVVFGEFQDVLTASAQMDAVIRSEIEHHGDAASYIFAGSHVGMMRELFTTQRRALTARRAQPSSARSGPKTSPSTSISGSLPVTAS